MSRRIVARLCIRATFSKHRRALVVAARLPQSGPREAPQPIQRRHRHGQPVPQRIRPRWTLRFTVENLTNKVALYNFLSSFSGTHFVAPRTYQASLGYAF